ncbi:unnamed protein product [Enterobius vermicularis]|uniref:Amiloride-sensitive sodium channel n=1 Tax=Enterobius vermicularis TaxID=51028 RepID=A0A0N4VN75_ENTVE|nr:unnamed protein product [Enterobius vermicularis]
MFNDYVNNATTSLTLIRSVKRLQFPTLVICPRKADAVHLKSLIKDVQQALPEADTDTAQNLLRFAIAGFGFANFEKDLQRWSNETIANLTYLYKEWKGSRTDKEMFLLIFEHFGYTCEEIFLSCQQYSRDLNCCELFEFTYVMLRSRCLRLKTLYQEDVDETAKLTVWLRKVPSSLSLRKYQDRYPEIPSCEPATTVANYETAVLTPTTTYRCLPACVRDEVIIQMYASESMYGSKDSRAYMLDASYNELQYELYKETLRTSLPGFVSQVGGQGGLFLGASITTFVQLAVSFVQFLSRRCRRTMQDSQVKVTSYRTLGVC